MLTNRQQFDSDLKMLRQEIIKMGEKVEQAIADSVQSLKTADAALAQKVIDGDKEINELEVRIDQIGTQLIATQQPVATDLRRILVAFQMAGDLERMADLAVDVAKVTLRIGGEELIKPLIDIPRMAEIVQSMSREGINSYIHEDVEQAYRMAKVDDEVDRMHGEILREMFTYMADNPGHVNQVLNLCFVSRYLERFADHATNIAESVVYLVKGERPDLN